MTLTCIHCSFDPIEPRKTVENNEVRTEGFYCPNCEHGYDEEPTAWEEHNFPIWISYEFYNDNWEMLRAIARKTGIPQDNVPHGDGQKYTCPLLWYKVDKGGNVHGPYAEKGDDTTI